MKFFLNASNYIIFFVDCRFCVTLFDVFLL